MAVVQVTNVQVLNNPARFLDPFQFEVSFHCFNPLREDIEWKLIYVGSSSSDEYDQELESILVGPVPVGASRFMFQADAPNPALIPLHELLGVTVVLLTCSYRSQEFFRVGYYVNNDYSDPELRENPPETVDINLIGREISIAEPRVTKVPIEWDDVVEEGAGMGNADEQQLGVPEGLLDDENSRSLGVE